MTHSTSSHGIVNLLGINGIATVEVVIPVRCEDSHCHAPSSQTRTKDDAEYDILHE